MLPINYGNFLSKEEHAAAMYEYNKPVISLVVKSITLFAVAAAVTVGMATGYSYISNPIQQYDTAQFNEAQKLSQEVSKSLGVSKEARPNGINVIDSVNKFMAPKTKEITITQLKIQPDKYTVTAQTENIEAANAYAQALDFGKDKRVNISNINTKDGLSEFTVTVTEIKKAKAAPSKGGQKK